MTALFNYFLALQIFPAMVDCLVLNNSNTDLKIDGAIHQCR